MASSLMDRSGVKLDSLSIALAQMASETRHGLIMVLLVRKATSDITPVQKIEYCLKSCAANLTVIASNLRCLLSH